MKKALAKIALAGLPAAVLSSAALAVTFDIDTANGFISRGDVISHPALGKSALPDGKNINTADSDVKISFSKDGSYWSQNCQKTTGKTETKQFRQGAVQARFSTEIRKSGGVSNVTGFILTGEGSSGTPTTLCPQSWEPVSSVVLEPGRGTGPLLIYRLQGPGDGWVRQLVSGTYVWNVWIR